MKRYSFIWAALLLTIMIFASGMSACGDKGHKAYPPKDAKVATCEKGRYGGTLKIGLSGVPLTFNPYTAYSPDTYEITSKLYGTLLDYDFANDKPGNDGLARSVDSINDGRTYKIFLREGANFSNGAPITADDVIFSFTVALDPKLDSLYGELMKLNGESPKLTKDDTYTVRITFPEHYEPIRLLLAKVPIISKASLEEAYLKGNYKESYTLDTAPDQIVCSGPFMLDSYKQDKEVNLKYNPYYYKVDSGGTSLPYVDGVSYYLKTTRQEQGYNLLTKNEYSFAQVLPKDLAQFTGNPRFFAKDMGPTLRTWQLALNWRADKNKVNPSKATWFRTPGFRRALSSSIDRERLVKEVLESMGTPAYNQIAPSNENWYYDKIAKYNNDVAGARSALTPLRFVVNELGNLKDAGNVTVRLELIHINEFVPTQIATRLVEDFKKIGVQLETSPQEPKKFWSLLNNGLFDMALVDSSPMFSDPVFMIPYFNKKGRFFWFYDALGGDTNLRGAVGTEGWMNKISEKLNEALKKGSLQERQEIFKEIQEDWADKAPMIYLLSENLIVASQNNIGNFKPAKVEPALTWNIEEFFIKR